MQYLFSLYLHRYFVIKSKAMKSFLFCLSLFLGIPFISYAQKIQHGDLPPIMPVTKCVYDTAFVKIYYRYDFLKDSTKTGKVEHGQTVLSIGREFTGFMDYIALLRDSLTDMYSRKGASSGEYMAKYIALGSPAYDYLLVLDLKQKEASIMFYTSVLKVQYSQPMPQLTWKLTECDSIICGVCCKKAMCKFGNRNWIAWYSPEYNLPFGPYLFGGLPGLIFLIYDDKHNHTFTINGIETCNDVVTPIYLRTESDIIKMPRDKAKKAIKNYFSDRETLILSKYPGTILPDDMRGKHVAYPYNPIELE